MPSLHSAQTSASPGSECRLSRSPGLGSSLCSTSEHWTNSFFDSHEQIQDPAVFLQLEFVKRWWIVEFTYWILKLSFFFSDQQMPCYILTSVTEKWTLLRASCIKPLCSVSNAHAELLTVKTWFFWMPFLIFSSSPCVAIWPPPVDFTVQADPHLRAATSRWNCVDKFIHFVSVFDGGQVCVFLSAVGLSFSPSHSLRNKVVLMENTCGDAPACEENKCLFC